MQATSNSLAFVNQDRISSVASSVRLAGNSCQRRRGLRGLTAFIDFGGLWIVPCEAIHTFGMRMSIDCLFLDKRLRVKKLRSNLKPRRIAVCLTAHSVLELPVGAIANSGTQVGDHLKPSSSAV